MPNKSVGRILRIVHFCVGAIYRQHVLSETTRRNFAVAFFPLDQHRLLAEILCRQSRSAAATASKSLAVGCGFEAMNASERSERAASLFIRKSGECFL